MTDDRRIEIEIEVTGTPEDVWEAIATGPGISAWFVPTDVEPGEGGTVTQHHGEGIDAPPSRIVAWDTPRRLKVEDPEWQPTPGSPAGRLATEWLVEARSGGTCIVRLVASGFGDGPEWERTREGNAVGWRSALETLRLYLEYFLREPLAHADAWAAAPGDRAATAAALRRATGVDGAAPGDAVASAPPAPALEGVVEAVIGDQVIVRTTVPTTGLAFIAAGGPGDETFAMVRMSLFGPDAAAVAAEAGPRWQAWLEAHLAGSSVNEQ